MVVELFPEEIKLCRFVAELRASSIGVNSLNTISSVSIDRVERNFIGYKAEFAFAKKFNLFPYAGGRHQLLRNGGGDGITRKEKVYDIKATTLSNGKLICQKKSSKNIDIFVFAVVYSSKVDFIGWANKEDFIKPENIKDLGYGETYVLDRKYLIPFNNNGFIGHYKIAQ